MFKLFAKLIEPKQQPPEGKQYFFSNRDLRSLIVPLIIEQVLGMLVGMADTMMVSYAGEAAISGVSLVDMLNGVCLYVFNALATGGTIIVSQYIGSGDNDNANKTAGQLLTLAVLTSFAFTALMVLGKSGVLGMLFGAAEQAVMDASGTYLYITAFSYPFMAAHSAFAALFRAMGNSKVTMKVSLGMNVLNVIGNYVGVFILDAGVTGVAVASLISRAVAAIVMFFMLLHSKGIIRLTARNIFTWRGRLMAKVLSVAIPNGVESGLFQICRVAMAGIIATFGTAQIAANGVALSIDNINTLVNSSVGLAIPTVVGRCVGANDYDQAKYYKHKMLGIAHLGSLAVNLLVISTLYFVLQLYDLSDEARSIAFVLVALHTLFTAVLATTSGPFTAVLRASGDVKFTLMTSVISMFLGRLLFSYVFSLWMGFEIVGMWMAMVPHWGITAALTALRYRSGKWQNKKLV